MSGFVKLYGSILDSSVWSESTATRIVWITLLAMADANGTVSASVGGLARRAQVSREEAAAALNTLLAPDPDDRSGVEDGRRLRVVQGGWQIVNHRSYRDLRTESQVKNADRVRRFREKHSVTCNDGNAPSHAVRAEAEAEAEAEADPDGDPDREAPPAPAAAAAPAPAGPPAKASRKRSPAKKPPTWRRVPTDWQPNDDHRALAASLGVSLDTEVPKFVDYEYSKPKTDADAAFRTWLRNAQAFGAGTRRSGPVQPNFGVVDPAKYSGGAE